MEFFFTVPDSSVEICNCALYPEMYRLTAVDDDLSHSLIICFYYTEPDNRRELFVHRQLQSRKRRFLLINRNRTGSAINFFIFLCILLMTFL